MQEKRLAAEGLLEVAAQDGAHFGKLGEDKRPVTDIEDFLDHFGQAGKFSGSIWNRGVVAKELGRMIANLL